MREVRVYDGDFPSHDQILSGDPGAVFPKEVWLQQMKQGEFAVRYKDFKTGLARNPAGEGVRSSEICRIFTNLEEARADSREIVKAHWIVRCFIYDHTGALVDTVSNNKDTGKFAAAMYSGILLWLGIFAISGMAFIWLVYKITTLVLRPVVSVDHPLGPFGWIAWVFAGLLIGILTWLFSLQFKAARRVDRLQRNLRMAISPEDQKRFNELNFLRGSKDPAERQRFLKLQHEYRERVRQALKK